MEGLAHHSALVPDTERLANELGNLEAVEVGNGDPCLEVADSPEVARVRHKLPAVLVEGIRRDHHVEGALAQRFLNADMPYARGQKLAPVTTPV